MELPDYYEILQVSEKADREVIQAAYGRLAMKYHPDRNPGDVSAERKMHLLNEAKEVLLDSARRAGYDRQRQAEREENRAAEEQRKSSAEAARAEEERLRHAERERQRGEEQARLEKIARSGEVERFFRENRGSWNRQTWSHFLLRITNIYGFVSSEQLESLVEQERERFWSRSSPYDSTTQPQSQARPLKPIMVLGAACSMMASIFACISAVIELTSAETKVIAIILDAATLIFSIPVFRALRNLATQSNLPRFRRAVTCSFTTFWIFSAISFSLYLLEGKAEGMKPVNLTVGIVVSLVLWRLFQYAIGSEQFRFWPLWGLWILWRLTSTFLIGQAGESARFEAFVAILFVCLAVIALLGYPIFLAITLIGNRKTLGTSAVLAGVWILVSVASIPTAILAAFAASAWDIPEDSFLIILSIWLILDILIYGLAFSILIGSNARCS